MGQLLIGSLTLAGVAGAASSANPCAGGGLLQQFFRFYQLRNVAEQLFANQMNLPK